MLQRFRQGRDFKVPDNSSTTSKGSKKQVSFDKENKWWLSNNNQVQTQASAQQQVEKQRYIKALKNMVQEKDIPSLCICGAAADPAKKNTAPQMCASNCQFYKNEKDYERALRDILACTQWK